MKAKNKGKGKEKEQALNTPTHAAVLASTSDTTAANRDLGNPPEAEEWKDVLQLLREQHPKMSSRKRGGILEEAGIPCHLEKDMYLSVTALCVSGRYPKKSHEGE